MEEKVSDWQRWWLQPRRQGPGTWLDQRSNLLWMFWYFNTRFASNFKVLKNCHFDSELLLKRETLLELRTKNLIWFEVQSTLWLVNTTCINVPELEIWLEYVTKKNLSWIKNKTPEIWFGLLTTFWHRLRPPLIISWSIFKGVVKFWLSFLAKIKKHWLAFWT